MLQSNSPQHQVARNAYSVLRTQGNVLVIVPQNVIEFWAVATRPVSVNGLGLSIDSTLQEISLMKQLFCLHLDTPEIFLVWEQLIARYQVAGKQAHDTQLVAAMHVHQINHLLTFNIEDFQWFSEITVINPQSVS